MNYSMSWLCLHGRRIFRLLPAAALFTAAVGAVENLFNTWAADFCGVQLWNITGYSHRMALVSGKKYFVFIVLQIPVSFSQR